jgi:hypothetical protein
MPYLAAFAPPHWTVIHIDEVARPVDFGMRADLVGITFHTRVPPRAYAMADEFRRRGIPVVLGGPHVTLSGTKNSVRSTAKAAAVVVTVLAFTMACAAVANAQTVIPTITIQIIIPSVNGPEPFLGIVNPGSTGGDVCANLYVFDAHQEMLECCSCPAGGRAQAGG